MIPLSTELVRRTPPWLCDKETGQPQAGAPVFLLKPATVIEREMFEAELASPPWNAARVHDSELFGEARDAVRAWSTGADLERHLEVLALAEAQRIEPDTAEAAHLASIEEVCMSPDGGWPAYKRLMARKARRNQFLPVLAAMSLLRGWENREEAFTAGPNGRPTEAALATLTPLELRWLGFEAWALLHLKAEVSPFSKRPSTSEHGRKSSGSGAPGRSARGTSAGKTGRKTRPSSSRRKSSRPSTSG